MSLKQFIKKWLKEKEEVMKELHSDIIDGIIIPNGRGSVKKSHIEVDLNEISIQK
jgi:hypothetical protein